MNPIIGATAEGTFHRTPNPTIFSALASAISLSQDLPTPDDPQPGLSTVKATPVDDAFQPDGSVAENPMSDAANDPATPETLVSTPHSKSLVERAQSLTIPSSSASAPAASTQVRQAESLSRISSPSMLHATTTSPAASGQDPPVQLSPKTATATSAHRISLQSRSPSMQSGLPVVSTAGDRLSSVTQSLESSQSSPRKSLPGAEMKDVGSCGLFKFGCANFGLQHSPPVAIALHSPAISPIVSGSISSPTLAPDLFQRRVSCNNNLLHGDLVLKYWRSSIYRLDLPLSCPPAYRLH